MRSSQVPWGNSVNYCFGLGIANSSMHNGTLERQVIWSVKIEKPEAFTLASTPTITVFGPAQAALSSSQFIPWVPVA